MKLGKRGSDCHHLEKPTLNAMSLFGSPAPGPVSSFRRWGGAGGSPGLPTRGGAVSSVWHLGRWEVTAQAHSGVFPPSTRVKLPGKALEKNAQIEGGSRGRGSGKACAPGRANPG